MVDEEVLAAICATSTTTTTTPAAPLTFELRVKRVGGVPYATVPIALDGRTTVGELKMQIEALQREYYSGAAGGSVIAAAGMQLLVAGRRLEDDDVLQDLFRAKTSRDNYLLVFYLPLPTQPAPAVGNEEGTPVTATTTTTSSSSTNNSDSSSSTSSSSSSSPRTITVAFTCLDSPESGPRGIVRVGRDASLFDLKKAVAAKAGLLL